MKNLRIIFLLPFFFFLHAHAQEGFAIGVEVGVAQLKNDSLSVQGSSWMFHAEYDIEPQFAFFGQAGQEFGRNGDDKISHNLFGGGVSFALLPMVDLRAGIALNTWEATEDSRKDEEEGLGPLVGVTAHQTLGSLKLGASATATRTGDYQSLGLRVFCIILMM
jgi:hypothetical protein